MELKKAISFIDGEIDKLEKACYMFDSIMVPRAQKDKEVLEQMRSHRLKMMVLSEKIAHKEEVTQDEINNLVPSQFR